MASIINDAVTFSVPPILSGANITSGTVPIASVAGTAVALSGTQTITGAKTFNATTVLGTNSTFATTSSSSYFLNSGYTGSNLVTSQSAVTTTDATVTVLVSIAVAEGDTITIDGFVTGSKDDHSDACGGKFCVTARRATGGNVSLTGGAPLIVVNATSTALFNAAVDTGTQTVRITVTGIAATTYYWVASYQYAKVLTSS